MKGSFRKVACAAAVVLAGAGFMGRASAQQDETQIVPLTDPSRPGKVEIGILNGGGISVRGENRRDVMVVMRAGSPGRTRNERPAPPGMRRLTQGAGFAISEERNEIRIEPSSFRGGGMLELRVPLRTDLELSSTNGGPITVENVEGEIEIQSVNNTVVLTNVAGSVVANSTNGGVTATLSRVAADKAMAFTSLNGKVDVTLPSNIKATLKMRSDNGDIFTDFDVQLQQPPPAASGGRRTSSGRFQVEVNRSLYGTVNGGGAEIELRTFNGSVYLRKGQ